MHAFCLNRLLFFWNIILTGACVFLIYFHFNNEAVLPTAINPIKDSLNKTETRLALTGTILNENLAAIYNRKLNDITYLNKNWTINHLPKHLNLSREDIEWLSTFIDKKSSSSIPESLD